MGVNELLAYVSALPADSTWLAWTVGRSGRGSPIVEEGKAAAVDERFWWLDEFNARRGIVAKPMTWSQWTGT